MANTMNKVEALQALICEAYKERRTRVGLNRVRKAMKSLGLTDKEMAEVECSLDYRDREYNLYQRFVRK